MSHELIEVDLDEVSLVDRGANQFSKVVLFKNDSDEHQQRLDMDRAMRRIGLRMMDRRLSRLSKRLKRS